MSFSLKHYTANRSILLQVGIVLILCQILAQAGTFLFMSWRYERPDLLTATSVSTTQAVGFYEVLRSASPAERVSLEKAMTHSELGLQVLRSDSLNVLPREFLSGGTMQDGLEKARPHLKSLLSVVTLPAGTGGEAAASREMLALSLGDGTSLVFDPEKGNQRVNLPRFMVPLVVAMLIIPLSVLSLWAARMLTAPLRRLAEGANRFAIDLDATPLPEQGPAEIQKLAHAFNAMKSRIRQLVESRSRMLAAVSHDLRTPLTRIRLRAEGSSDGEDRDRMLRDVDTMDRMISHSLSYLRDQASPAKHERVDLSALIESICDDFVDIGRKASLSGQRHIVIECEPDLMTRALSNLIDNAIKFGGIAEVSIAMRSASHVVIHVFDEGPGIPDDAKFAAFEPFTRGDPSRSDVDTDGFGLGLAIAKQVVERHGGQITLHDRHPVGLDVQIVLPVAGPQVTRLNSQPNKAVLMERHSAERAS